MSLCPCCSYSLVRQIKAGKVYWFCPHCWQAMPNFEERSKIVHYCQNLEEINLETKTLLKKKVFSTVAI